MAGVVPRLRMFAGPNGSGKSSLKSLVSPEMCGIYINPDEIEKEIGLRDFLDLAQFGVKTTKEDVLDFFLKSSLLNSADLIEEASLLKFNDDKLIFHEVIVNSYFASVAADFIRHKLIQAGQSFTFETVMSSPDKLELLRKAQERGYRTYLYYIATEDVEINISRVANRVTMGGHNVPKDKIVSRYYRSLDLLMDAIRCTNRAYIFDNSGDEKVWVAEITDSRMLEMKTADIPSWFESKVLDKFKVE